MRNFDYKIFNNNFLQININRDNWSSIRLTKGRYREEARRVPRRLSMIKMTTITM